MIAKCGSIYTHHWAHEASADCDSWSEPVGPWHLAWQDIIRPEFVEVPMHEHRADIVGNGGRIVELQHSPINSDHIQTREQFYGNMVWLFDATYRFRMVETGDRVFFSFGQTKHILGCTRPVFLDFGATLVQVEKFTDVFHKCSGFGWKRDRQWFAAEFLSDVRLPDSKMSAGISDDPCPSNPWESKCPYSVTRFPSVWIDPVASAQVTFPTNTPFLRLNYDWSHPRTGSRSVWSDVIEKHPEIANGWTKAALDEMKRFFAGTPMILGGLLRVMPAPADEISVTASIDSTKALLHRADGHIAAGRLPVLKEQTKQLLLDRARNPPPPWAYTRRVPITPAPPSPPIKPAQPRLFD